MSKKFSKEAIKESGEILIGSIKPEIKAIGKLLIENNEVLATMLNKYRTFFE